jgi:16S rRNA (guanine966-N2)-methyltransferase
MRVIGGTYRSRLLKSLKGQALRPTSDYLRETLFNVLGDAVRGSRFLDVFAGTGAVGIEALSRGAEQVVFIEKHAAAATLIMRNLESLGVRGGTQVLGMDAVRGLEQLASRRTSASNVADPAHGGTRFDFIFIDPPYAQADDYDRVLRSLGASELLAAKGILIIEHHRKKELPEEVGGLHRVRVLRQGDAALTFYRPENVGARTQV